MCEWTTLCLSINRHLGCFPLLASVSNTAVNTGVQVSVHVPVFSSWARIPKSGIAASDRSSSFNLLRKLYGLSQRPPHLSPLAAVRTVPGPPYPHRHACSGIVIHPDARGACPQLYVDLSATNGTVTFLTIFPIFSSFVSRCPHSPEAL